MAGLLIFTIVAAAAGVYAVLPEHRRLRIHYVLPSWYPQVVLFSIVAVLILSLGNLYLETANPQFSLLCGWICLPAQFWIEGTQVILATAVVGIGVKRLLGSTPTIEDDSALAEQIRGLFSEQRFNVLSLVISDGYSKLVSTGTVESASESRAVTESVLTQERFLQNHTEISISLAAQLLQDEDCVIDRSDFALHYIKSLHHDRSSILYHEVEVTGGGNGPYNFPDSIRLLPVFFDDCNVAREVKLWNPIREGMQGTLEEAASQPEDPYATRNNRLSSNRREVQFRDPIFVGIRLFNIMVHTSLEQEIEWHMFVNYLADIGEDICEQFTISPEADQTAEYPNDYCYLLREITDTLESIAETPTDTSTSVYMAIETPGPVPYEDTIKMGIWSLLRVHKAILLSDVPHRFKRDTTHSILETYFELATARTHPQRSYFWALHTMITTQVHQNPLNDHDQHEYLITMLRHLKTYDRAKLLMGHKGTEYRRLIRDVENSIFLAEIS